MDDGTGRVVVFRSVVPQQCSDDQFNSVLDKLSRAGERQKSLVLLPTYESELAAKRETLKVETEKAFSATEERDRFRDAWARESVQSGRRNPKLSPQQSETLKKLEAMIGQHEQNIRVLEKQIASETQRVELYKGRLGTGG